MTDEGAQLGENEMHLIGLVEAMMEAARNDPRWTGDERIFVSVSIDASGGNDCGVGRFEGYDNKSPSILLGDIQAFLQGTAQRTGLSLQFLPIQSMN